MVVDNWLLIDQRLGFFRKANTLMSQTQTLVISGLPCSTHSQCSSPLSQMEGERPKGSIPRRQPLIRRMYGMQKRKERFITPALKDQLSLKDLSIFYDK